MVNVIIDRAINGHLKYEHKFLPSRAVVGVGTSNRAATITDIMSALLLAHAG